MITRIFVLLAALVLPAAAAHASDLEDKLYKSCFAGSVNRTHVESVCRCQAKKWAAGKIADPHDGTKIVDIPKEYIDHLASAWNYNLGKNSKKEGKEGDMVATALNISFACSIESSGEK